MSEAREPSAWVGTATDNRFPLLHAARKGHCKIKWLNDFDPIVSVEKESILGNRDAGAKMFESARMPVGYIALFVFWTHHRCVRHRLDRTTGGAELHLSPYGALP